VERSKPYDLYFAMLFVRRKLYGETEDRSVLLQELQGESATGSECEISDAKKGSEVHSLSGGGTEGDRFDGGARSAGAMRVRGWDVFSA
jgi:hypothetical protein